ncbi:hypothetical protein OG21DRAFT_1507594 [Imleria badia]|nr:hypothetical protein OG21DRAFT_1507594 [Imleria badia]
MREASSIQGSWKGYDTYESYQSNAKLRRGSIRFSVKTSASIMVEFWIIFCGDRVGYRNLIDV